MKRQLEKEQRKDPQTTKVVWPKNIEIIEEKMKGGDIPVPRSHYSTSLQRKYNQVMLQGANRHGY